MLSYQLKSLNAIRKPDFCYYAFRNLVAINI